MERKLMRGDVLFADLDPIKGSEQGGCRPVLVLQNEVGNQYSTTTIIAAITSRKKIDLPTHVPLAGTPFLETDSMVLLEQLRTLDKLRFHKYLGRVDKVLMLKITDALAISLGMVGNTNTPLIFTLCNSCAKQFYNSCEHIIYRLNHEQTDKEPCNVLQCTHRVRLFNNKKG